MSDIVVAGACWAVVSVPFGLVLVALLRRVDAADERAAEERVRWADERAMIEARYRAERDELIRTALAATGNGAAAMALRTTRPELGDAPSARERLLAEARAAAVAQAREDRGELSPGEMIPVGMGGE